MMTDPTETEIDPWIVEELQALRDHVKELDREASQVRAIAEASVRWPRPSSPSPWARTVGALAGLAGIAIGCWLVAPALAWIVLGSILLGIVLAGSILQKRGNDV